MSRDFKNVRNWTTYCRLIMYSLKNNLVFGDIQKFKSFFSYFFYPCQIHLWFFSFGNIFFLQIFPLGGKLFPVFSAIVSIEKLHLENLVTCTFAFPYNDVNNCNLNWLILFKNCEKEIFFKVCALIEVVYHWKSWHKCF